MTIALVCPSNFLYMPYVDNYEKILKKNNVNYKKINWDRLGIEDYSNFTYRDNKVGHQRQYLDYLKFSKFVIRILKKDKYDKIIVFGLQLAYFLEKYLIRYYKDKYILDIRDYNKILTIFNAKRIINFSRFTVISSPGYLEWLPKSEKYVINHNTTVDNLNCLSEFEYIQKGKKINISYIGTLVNLNENKLLINNLKNNKNFSLVFHGDGIINTMLESYIKQENINNVKVYGRYQREQEIELYNQANLINMLLSNENINNRTCLANRIYNSALYGKLMIALKGTYLAEVINEYNLGLVLESYENIDRNIINYLNDFNKEEYNNSRINFFKNIIKDNEIFKKELLNAVQK